MSYTRILMSASIIAFVGALVLGGTQAFFSDEEVSEGNTFSAGAIDLLVDSQAHYAGLYCNDQGVWEVEDDNDGTTRPDLEGEACDGTWTETDLGPEHTFFNYGDLKPGDNGENTISLHVVDNDAYACAIIDNMQDDDNGTNEPEEEAGDTTPGDGEGELSQEIRFFAWADDGDNIWENGEPMLFSNEEGPASDVIDGVVYPLFTPDLNGGAVLEATTTAYIGLYWCYGDIDVDEGTNTLTCDGAGGTNLTQSDSLSADITFYVEQARNNGEFVCPVLEEELPVVGAQELASFVAPFSCAVIVDDDFQGDTPGSEYTTIQGAVDDTANVPDGSVICVDDGVYDEFSVDRPLTVAGLTNPALGSAKVMPSAAAVTELAYITSSDVTVSGLHFDGEGTSFTGSQTAGVQISSTGGDIDNVNIMYNVIENLHATDANAANKGIQWFSEANDGDVLTDSTFSYNIISDIKADSKGAYGIQTVGATDGLTIMYNTIEDIDGAWGAGIAMDTKDTGLTSVTDTSIHHNHIFDSLGANEVAVQVEFKVAASDVSLNMNNITSALQGGGNADLNTEGILDAENNWWGDLDPSDNVFGDVDYDPFEVSAFPN